MADLIRFGEDTTTYEAELIISENIISMAFLGEVPSDTLLVQPILHINEMNDSVMDVWEGYTTIYNRTNNTIILSNDNSVYVEPTKTINVYISWDDSNNADNMRPSSVSVIATPSEGSDVVLNIDADSSWVGTINDVPEHIVYTFTVPAIAQYESTVKKEFITIKHASLEFAREAKISELQDIQQQLISNGCDVTLTDGTVEHFTLTEHDQTSILGLALQVSTGSERIPWHTSDHEEACKYYSNADMSLIVNGSVGWITYHVTYFRDLRRYVLSLSAIEDISNVNYGDMIPVEYQSEVLKDLLAQMSANN